MYANRRQVCLFLSLSIEKDTSQTVHRSSNRSVGGSDCEPSDDEWMRDVCALFESSREEETKCEQQIGYIWRMQYHLSVRAYESGWSACEWVAIVWLYYSIQQVGWSWWWLFKLKRRVRATEAIIQRQQRLWLWLRLRLRLRWWWRWRRWLKENGHSNSDTPPIHEQRHRSQQTQKRRHTVKHLWVSRISIGLLSSRPSICSDLFVIFIMFVVARIQCNNNNNNNFVSRIQSSVCCTVYVLCVFCHCALL